MSLEPLIIVVYKDGSVREFSAVASTRAERDNPMKMQALVLFKPAPLIIRLRTDEDDFSRIVENSYRPDGSVRTRMWFRLGRVKVVWDEDAPAPIVDISG